MKTLKKYLPDIIVVVLFAAIGFAYFLPADLEGRVLYQHDAQAGVGAGQEISRYYEQTGERSRWTNALFSGMPTYQMSPSYKSDKVITTAQTVYHLGLPEYVWYVFAYLLGFYILLRAFNFRWYLALLGSVAWAFSSYFLIIIAAGHIWKVMALAYLPPMIGGVVLAYRGKYLWGFIVTAIFAAFEVKANHVQMTYYFLFIILFMVIAWLVEAIREHWLPRFLKASATVALAAALGICMNLSNLYHTWQYSQESMRGKSELVKADAANQTSSGLDRDYITQWSYGIGETWTLLVPNAKGGASVPLSQNETAMKKADPQFMQIYQQLGQYWGEQPGTSGPVYVGAFILFLFVLGCFIVKGPMKWALLAATILSILLSWGKNFMGFTNLFLDYVPMYAKFRTVASILVIAEFTIPLLAIMAVKKIIDEPDILKRKRPWVIVSLCLTAGVALVAWVSPSFLSSGFISSAENEALAQLPAEYLGPLKANLTSMREAMLSADAGRSLLIILIGVALIVLYQYKKLRASWMVGCLAFLCLFDLWQVDKRYLNDEMFVERSVRETKQEMTNTDRLILQDKGLDYRVLNLASNTFNENETSYYHKSIGGYHAAKLRRYQELIDQYIAPEMRGIFTSINQAGGDMTKVPGDSVFPVLNMLNAKYFILPLQNGQNMPLENPYANGNAWFVNKLTYVDNANQELDGLAKIDLRHEAVADKKFEPQLGKAASQGAPDSTATATIKTYAPNHLTYKVNSTKGGLLVFSEIYYPGWTATVDGQPVELGRVNYVLRAMQVKPGKHEVVLDFHPASIRKTEDVAYAAYGILALLTALGIFFSWRKRRKEEPQA